MVSAAFDLGKDKVGALIVIEKDISLEAFEKTGIELDAAVTRELLLQIFVHNTPLHDGAVVIRNDRVAAATCILRVSKNSSISKELGTRHRAALGVSEDTDAFTIIVSEETGAVSLTQDGNLMHDIDRETLRRELENIQALRKDESERRWYQFWKKAPAISEEKEEEIREALDEANIEEDRPVSVHAETEMLSAAPLKEYGAESKKKELPVDTPDELTEEFEKEAAEEGRGVTDETDPV
ncbi:MAG: DNA integrity scanning protein DisA nucleotide-binding domain protein [Lachnospiraceae bacterium]|nr:DNA integrity scanning protein DisA nucleotide-binding domain protein [Lachnospiraceae bacterium]